jgi:hypothetical protein
MPEQDKPIGINEPAADEFVGHIRITNHNDFELSDHYDGRLYTFYPSKPITVPVDVARHIFGFGLSEEAQKNYVMRRMGWNTVEMAKDAKNIKFWKNLDIRPVLFRMVEVNEQGDELEKPQPRPGRPRKVQSHPDMILDDPFEKSAS